jgi:hypothetical protein
MNITKLTYSPTDLSALPESHVSAFLIVGHLLNEANILRKLIGISNLQALENEAEDKASLTMSLMLANSIASKIHAGWMSIRKISSDPDFAAVFSDSSVKDPHDQLAPLVAKNSIVHRFRNAHGAHYPDKLSLANLPGIAAEDVSLYTTKYDGDMLSLISALCAASTLVEISGDKTVGEALSNVIDTIVKAAEHYCTMLLHIILLFVQKVITAPAAQSVIVNHARPIDEIRLPFFNDPPVSHSASDTETVL